MRVLLPEINQETNTFCATPAVLEDYKRTLFAEGEDGRYDRSDEEQTERCYSEDALRSALDRAGFDLCGIFGGFDFSAPAPTAERWHIVARTRKRGDWYLCADQNTNTQ